MIKQDDAFVTLESLETIEQDFALKIPENNVDKAAIALLNLVLIPAFCGMVWRLALRAEKVWAARGGAKL